MASSVYKYSSCRSAVYTACVMLSAASTRRGSHAAAQDYFEQVPIQRRTCVLKMLLCTQWVHYEHDDDDREYVQGMVKPP